MKDSNDKSYLNCVVLAQEVSEEKKFSILLTVHSSDILVTNMTAFCLCPKSLPEAMVKSFGLISLAEESSKQPSTDLVVWLLVVTLMEIF